MNAVDSTLDPLKKRLSVLNISQIHANESKQFQQESQQKEKTLVHLRLLYK